MYARALCHPARVEIMRLLQKSNGLFVYEIESQLPLGPAAVTDHLKILRESELIQVEWQGRYNHYTLNCATVSDVRNRMQTLFSQLLSAKSAEVDETSGTR